MDRLVALAVHRRYLMVGMLIAVVIGGLISGLSVNTVKNESSRNFGKKMAKFDLADASGITKGGKHAMLAMPPPW